MNILLDRNIVLRNSMRVEPDRSEVRDAIARMVQRNWLPCVGPQILYEFWVVATRPVEANGLGLSPDVAHAESSTIIRSFRSLHDPADLVSIWLDICTRYQVRGRQAHDARLVALMLAHGINHILTLNPRDYLAVHRDYLPGAA